MAPVLRAAGQVALGGVLLVAGTAHLTSARQEFQAQVPPWVPLDPDAVVVGSGIVELVLGASLVVTWRSPARPVVGAVVAAFFVAVLPGNISQLVTRTDAFGLDTDAARAVRLLFQPLLVVWALWSTGAWRAWRGRRTRRRARGSSGVSRTRSDPASASVTRRPPARG